MQYLMDKLEFYLHFFGYAKDEREPYINLDSETNHEDAPGTAASLGSGSSSPTKKPDRTSGCLNKFEFYDYNGKASKAN